MTLQQLRYAMVVAQTGSMNKAAESLFISQPTLTNTIRGLEEESGITIFNRTNKGHTTTGPMPSAAPLRMAWAFFV